MTIKERNEYFHLEATAATIGKYIHKDGIYSKAREELHTRLMKPYSTEGTGEQMLIYAHTPSIDQQRVDDLFFDLQKWHRSNEQQLNRIKYNIRRKVAQLNLERSQEYRGRSSTWSLALPSPGFRTRKYGNTVRNRCAGAVSDFRFL